MRWFVEISPLGAKSAPSTLVVEAPQWKHALQKARALRGDDGPLGNFSIDLLDDGYRAIDPVARLRYEVKRAPEDAPITTSVPPPAKASVPPSAKASVPPVKATEETIAYASTGEARVVEAAKPEPAKVAAEPAKVAAEPAKVAAEPAKVAAEPAKVAAEPAKPSARSAGEGIPSFTLVSSREDEPTESAPLTYRELVFAVAAGTSEDDARRLILDRFEDLRGTLDGGRSGKLVNVAVFDHVFKGKPQRRPLVTLTWKDWRGTEPELQFPARQAESARASAPSAPSPSAAPKAASSAPKAASSAPASAAKPAGAPAPVPATLNSARPVVLPKSAPDTEVPVVAASAPQSAKLVEPAPRPVKAEEPIAAPQPVKAEDAVVAMRVVSVGEEPDSAVLTRPIPTVASPATAEPPAKAAPIATPSAKPAAAAKAEPAAKPAPAAKSEPAKPAAKVAPVTTPSAKPAAAAKAAAVPATLRNSSPAKKRLSGDDLITELFEAFGDLHFVRDALEGAEFVLALTMEKLPSEVAVVSFFDMNKREFVIVRQSGGPKSALCARQPERAPLAFSAMRRRHAIVVADKEGAAKATDDRFRAMGVEIKTMICAPVELAGRYLGLIEVANPLDGHVFNEGDGNALTYIGQQFAEFVATHGVIVDPEHIREPKPPPPRVPPPPASKKTR